MSTRGVDDFQYTKKYCVGIKKNQVLLPGILYLFHFSAIIFHVDSCESYATLDTDERRKIGMILYLYSHPLRAPDFSAFTKAVFYVIIKKSKSTHVQKWRVQHDLPHSHLRRRAEPN